MALGLNKHFPRALLHGSTLFRGIGIPTAKQKATMECLNYFLYSICHTSTITQKFEASIILFNWRLTQFFSLPFE
jgi:hypothetical protein